ncbi:tetratricopeptide repeat protein, partial [Spirillospora sp. NPDC049652]
AEEADRGLRGPDQHAWLSRLDAEAAGLRAASHACVQHGDAALALRLACALAWYWVLRGRVAEGRRTLAAALAVAPAAGSGADAPDEVLRATAMTWQAGIAALAGEPPDALVDDRHAAVRPCLDVLDALDPAGDGLAAPERAAFARAVLLLAIVSPIDVASPADDPVVRLYAVFERLGDRWGEAAALSVLAYHAQLLGDFPVLRRYAHRSLDLFRGIGDRWGLLQAATPLADAARLAGDYEQAARWYADGLRIARELGLRAEEARQLTGAGHIAQLHGEHARARQLYLRARELAADESVKVMEQVADLGLAVSARRQGRHDEAERLLLPWLDWNRRADWPAGMASVLAELGYVAEQRGDARTGSRTPRRP